MSMAVILEPRPHDDTGLECFNGGKTIAGSSMGEVVHNGVIVIGSILRVHRCSGVFLERSLEVWAKCRFSAFRLQCEREIYSLSRIFSVLILMYASRSGRDCSCSKPEWKQTRHVQRDFVQNWSLLFSTTIQIRTCSRSFPSLHT